MFASVRTPSRNAATRPISDHIWLHTDSFIQSCSKTVLPLLCVSLRPGLSERSLAEIREYVCFFLQDGASNSYTFEQLPLKYLPANVHCRREAEPPCATGRIVARGPEPASQTKTMACLSRTVSGPKTRSWVARRKIGEHR